MVYLNFKAGSVIRFDFFDSLGLLGFLAYVVAVIEAAGGIAIILGMGTRIVSGLFALVMAGALVKVKFAAGFMGTV
jgi:putative oxidoreductase